SRATSTSRRRSTRSTPTPSLPGWSATTSRPTSGAHSDTACGRCSCAPGSSGPTSSTPPGSSPTASSRRSRSSRSGSRPIPDATRRRPDRDRARPPRPRASRRRLPRALRHRRRTRVLRRESEPGAALRRPLRGEGGGRQGARHGRPLHLEGDRDQRPAEAGRPPLGADGARGGAARRSADRREHDALARARRSGRGGRARMIPLLTAEETRRAEEAHAGSLDRLMERAGRTVAELVLAELPGRVAVVCGGGNNGGDGRVCARVLREHGRDVTVVEQVGDLGDADVIVDALLGIGLRDAPREDVARMIEQINGAGVPVVAVDVPSGVNASTGEVPGAAVEATATVTFGAPKVGLAVAPGRFHAGSVRVEPIGLEPARSEHALVPAEILRQVPRKSRRSTKYRAGSVLVVGGSPGLTGAPMLTALAAFRADAGYVAVGAPESTLPVLEAGLLEAVKRPLPQDAGGRLLPRAADAVVEAAARADAVALGPGLGRTE